MKKVLIACDHRGIAMRDKIVEWCNEHGFQPVDMGPKDAASVDYPDYAVPLCEEVAKNQDGPVVGVLVCGWGNG
ncbi:MAG TPA: RpiB/LacA/LacB family sugar-phosphate isomerase, partial [bacterium]